MDYYGSKQFVELLRSIKNIEPIVLPKSEQCYYCRFDCRFDCYSFCECNENKINIKCIELIKERPEKNYNKCKKYFHYYYYSRPCDYYGDYDYDYYDDIDLMFEIENYIIKELDDPIENIKYLEFLLNEINEDCELYYLIKKSIQH